MRKILTTLAVAMALTACEQNTKPAQRDAERLEKQADRIEKQGDTAEKKFDQRADKLRDAADAIEDGLTYEVARVDKDAGEVQLVRKAKDGEIALQAGRELTVTFWELDAFIGGDKSGREIANELHEGENIQVFMDADGKITKLDY